MISCSLNDMEVLPKGPRCPITFLLDFHDDLLENNLGDNIEGL
jgi:hypothetical protein